MRSGRETDPLKNLSVGERWTVVYQDDEAGDGDDEYGEEDLVLFSLLSG
jgi:hypothetical protein